MENPAAAEAPIAERIEVRWNDMDAFGHVNNVVYFTFFETARIKYFERVAMFDREGFGNQGPALVSTTCNFRKQVHYPATLICTAQVLKLGNSSITFEHIITDESTGSVVADGQGIAVWTDYNQGKSTPMPEHLRAAIREVEGRDGL